MSPADEPTKIGSSPLAIAALQVISLEFADIVGEPLMGDGQFRHALFEPLMRRHQLGHALFEPSVRPGQFSDLRYQLLETPLGFKPQSGYLLWKGHKLVAEQQASEFCPPLWSLL